MTEDGIDQVEFINQYDIGQVKTERVNLKSFDEIMDIYEKMMLIQNADTLNLSLIHIWWPPDQKKKNRET